MNSIPFALTPGYLDKVELTRVNFSFYSFLNSHLSVSRLTDILLVDFGLSPTKGMSSAEEEFSYSGM